MSVDSISSEKNNAFTEVKEVPSSNVLLQCRTVVEKDMFVSTGILTTVEGDMLEVEIGDYKQFELGENVKLTVYSPAGIYIIHSTIIAKDNGALMVINPPQNQRKFQDRREHHRVDVEKNGFIKAASPAVSKSDFTNKVPVVVNNISVSGIGFTVSEMINLPKGSIIEMQIDIGTELLCIAEIVRSQEGEEGVFYGAQFIRLPEDKLNSLRAFILKAQVEFHATNKKEEQFKRNFK